MPSIEVSTDFYRQGIIGIEYLGMIRKMAAINFYIRGLNPGNISQGDSLAKFKKEFFPESATVILANPPFGAERDQEAYPDVWAEYPKESETTILFVKLKLETLKPGGRCAVIVSEGFMTWNQNSARALRKSLLDEANLRAIISLPQGVFVSKGGQGPKTSILYFEKPLKATPTTQATRDVWFYKVTNDGYTMGTNRKQIAGCQLVEALDLFHKYVRQGKMPPETRHSFTVPASWIRTLDPRIKERIRTETRTELSARAEQERAKLFESLKKKLDDGKLTAADMDERLGQHETLWQNKIANETAKRIERAHLFSFNLPNYRSMLTEAQRQAWRQSGTAGAVKEGRESLDARWEKIQKATPEELPSLLSKIDPANALELDLARQRLTDLDTKKTQANKKLKELAAILDSRQKYQRVKLKELIEPVFERIKKKDYDGSIPIVEKISFADGKIHFREGRETGMDLYRAAKGELLTSKINVHQGAVALAPCELVASTHYQVYRIHADEVHPAFLVSVLRSPQFLLQLAEQKNKGIKNEQGPDFFTEFEIPLPPLEEQERIAAEIERQQAIIEGAEMVIGSWQIDDTIFEPREGCVIEQLGNVCRFMGGSQPAKDEFIYEEREGYVRLVQIRDFKSDEYKTFVRRESVKKFFDKDDIMIGRYGPPLFQILRGLSGAYNVALMKAVPNESRLLRDYLFYFLQNNKIQAFVISNSQRSSGQTGVNTDLLDSYPIALPPLEEQKLIVERLNKTKKAFDAVFVLQKEAKDRLDYVIEQIWMK